VIRVQDSCGNFNDYTYNTRVDGTAPTIGCPSDISTTVVAPGDSSVSVSFTVSATDNCTGMTIAVSATGVTWTSSTSCTISGNSGNCSFTGTFPVGNTTVTATATDTCGNQSVCTFKVKVKSKPKTNLTASPTPVQYSDKVTLQAAVTAAPVPGQPLTGNVQFFLNGPTLIGTAPVSPTGIATLVVQNNHSIATTDSATAQFTSTSAFYDDSALTTPATSLPPAVENARIEYTGDGIGVIGVNLTLQATVWDSAAAGSGIPDPDATLGSLPKIWVAFEIYTLTGTTPIATKYAQVVDTGVLGDGIGTATSTYTSSSEATYLVRAKLVAGASGGVNQWYNADPAVDAGITFYDNIGQFVTGGGWVPDPTGGHGNFGFIARFNKNNKPQGQMVYVWRGLYGSVPADFKIKSNALDALSFTGSTYPISATLQGKCNIQVTKQSDGSSLFGSGGATFIARVTDSGKSSGIDSDLFELTVTDNSATYKSVPPSLLKGGNVVIHLK
jgi:hypothetical protein